MDTSCDYCGQSGHDWPVHDDARAEVDAWQRELQARSTE